MLLFETLLMMQQSTLKSIVYGPQIQVDEKLAVEIQIFPKAKIARLVCTI